MAGAAVLDLGDVQYYCGGYQAFLNSYDKSWGRVKSITMPSVGNHEYITSPAADRTGCDASNTGAAGYYKYFGAAAGQPGQGYYSFDIGTWHAIVLNSSCSGAGGCSPTTTQGKWLRADLAAHKNYCTLAYWHIPLYSSGGRAAATYKTFWDALYAADADLVLAGHDHTYERFAPQDPNGVKDTSRGLREFVVGTGGANHTSFTTIFPNSEVRNSDTFGVLKLTLHPTSYDWQFVPEAGKTFTDSGTTSCHGTQKPPPPTTPPPTPTPATPPASPASPPPPTPGSPGGTVPARCTLLLSSRLQVQSRTAVTGSLDQDCASAGTDTARWDIRHRGTARSRRSRSAAGSRSSTWKVTDATPLGTYDVVPRGAFDQDTAGTPKAVPQNTLTASLRLQVVADSRGAALRKPRRAARKGDPMVPVGRRRAAVAPPGGAVLGEQLPGVRVARDQDAEDRRHGPVLVPGVLPEGAALVGSNRRPPVHLGGPTVRQPRGADRLRATRGTRKGWPARARRAGVWPHADPDCTARDCGESATTGSG